MMHSKGSTDRGRTSAEPALEVKRCFTPLRGSREMLKALIAVHCGTRQPFGGERR